MDELYGNETTTSQDELEVRYDKELSEAERKQASAPDKDPDRKHFRHFDYGIDTQDNVIIIEGEIQSGMTFDVISKSRLLNKLNGGDVKTFNILLNTPGGDVIETLGLIDFMRSQEKQGIKYNIIVRGAAMSAEHYYWRVVRVLVWHPNTQRLWYTNCLLCSSKLVM